MNVQELVELLAACDPRAEVLLPDDGGNFTPTDITRITDSEEIVRPDGAVVRTIVTRMQVLIS